MNTMLQEEIRVTVGVDTHLDVHVAVALDQLGRCLGATAIPTTRPGFKQLVEWASEYGVVEQFGIEGAGSFGAGLTRFLRSRGLVVIEAGRHKRRDRHSRGKSDTIDAELAARNVLAGTAVAVPKTADGPVEMIRVLRIARESAVRQARSATNQLWGLVTSAPDDLRDRLRGLPTTKLVATAARFRISGVDSVQAATKFSLRELARRAQYLQEQIDHLNAELEPLVARTAPNLVSRFGIGTHAAAALLVTAGDNVERLRSERSFANLTGTAPIDASSGKQERHRLNRGGDRDANCAVHHIAITRMAKDPATRAYIARRRQEGKTKREAIRSLKRYIAREVYQELTAVPALDPAACEP